MADNNSEILALLAESMRAADRDRAENTHRFERLNEVMLNGFLRLEDRLGARIDNLADELGFLKEEVTELKTDMREVKADVQVLKADVQELKADMREVKTDIRELKVQAQETNRRLGNIFDHVGQLTEAADSNHLRLNLVEQAQQPTNAELDARLRATEEQLRNAS